MASALEEVVGDVWPVPLHTQDNLLWITAASGPILHTGPRPHVSWLLCILQMVQKRGKAFVCGSRDADRPG